jgi:hypothetical protein
MGKGAPDLLDDLLVSERLLHEIKGAALHRFHRHGHVAVSSDYDDRQENTSDTHFTL